MIEKVGLKQKTAFFYGLNDVNEERLLFTRTVPIEKTEKEVFDYFKKYEPLMAAYKNVYVTFENRYN